MQRLSRDNTKDGRVNIFEFRIKEYYKHLNKENMTKRIYYKRFTFMFLEEISRFFMRFPKDIAKGTKCSKTPID